MRLGIDWDGDLTPAERDAFVERVADEINRRRLTTPAVLALEMHKPLAHLGGQALALGSPILLPFFRPETIRTLYRLLDSRDGVEALIAAIERGSRPQSAPEAA